MILKVNSIVLKRNNRLLFENFSLSLNSSQIIILKGENGIGKSTLLHSIIGLIDLFSGQITINGIDSQKIISNDSELFFFLGHDNCLKDNLTVLENLRIWTSLVNLKPNDEEIIEKLNYFKLNEFFNYQIKNLSSGQKRKVALSKLLFSNARLWILDEPTNGLDDESESLFEDLLKKHQKKKGSVLLSSHLQFKNSNYKTIRLKKPRKKKSFEIAHWSDL